MPLHYSNGSSKTNIAELYNSFSSSKSKIKELYYSNGSTKSLVWSNSAGGWDFFSYQSNNNQDEVYIINSKTGKTKYMGIIAIPNQTYPDGYAHTITRYRELGFYNNNGTLLRTSTNGSLEVNISTGEWPISKKSNFYLTIKNESNSVGKNNYYAYNFTTDASITSVSTAFSATTILNSDKILIWSGGTSSGSTNYEQPVSVGGTPYTGGRLSSYFGQFVTLPYNYGFVFYRDGVNPVVNNSSLSVFKMNSAGNAYELKYNASIGGSIRQVIALDDSFIVFSVQTVTPPPGTSASWYYNMFLTKIRYDGYVEQFKELNIESVIGYNNTAPHQFITYIGVGQNLITGFNNLTKEFETFEVYNNGIRFISSAPIDNTNLSLSILAYCINGGYIAQYY